MMAPKTKATPEECEQEFRERAEARGMVYRKYEDSHLAKKNKQSTKPGYFKHTMRES